MNALLLIACISMSTGTFIVALAAVLSDSSREEQKPPAMPVRLRALALRKNLLC